VDTRFADKIRATSQPGAIFFGLAALRVAEKMLHRRDFRRASSPFSLLFVDTSLQRSAEAEKSQ
jgi:hypothetical protein